jgi:hypothetical protein
MSEKVCFTIWDLVLICGVAGGIVAVVLFVILSLTDRLK